MAGHRDDGSYAENKAFHLNRKVDRHRLTQEWNNPLNPETDYPDDDYDAATGPPAGQVLGRRPVQGEFDDYMGDEVWKMVQRLKDGD